MQNNVKEILDDIWNQAYEIFADMDDLNDFELLQCRRNIKGRAKSIMSLSMKEEYYD